MNEILQPWQLLFCDVSFAPATGRSAALGRPNPKYQEHQATLQEAPGHVLLHRWRPELEGSSCFR